MFSSSVFTSIYALHASNKNMIQYHVQNYKTSNIITIEVHEIKNILQT